MQAKSRITGINIFIIIHSRRSKKRSQFEHFFYQISNISVDKQYLRSDQSFFV